jgi:hypothetical protein
MYVCTNTSTSRKQTPNGGYSGITIIDTIIHHILHTHTNDAYILHIHIHIQTAGEAPSTGYRGPMGALRYSGLPIRRYVCVYVCNMYTQL